MSDAPLDVANLRRDYQRAALDQTEVAKDPIQQFDRWLKQAIAAEIPEPTAMTLATVAASGRPSARILLLKAYGPQGFTFFTNYESRKGQELAHNAAASMVFYWAELERQVRIEGTVEKAPAAEADDYYASRPALSRLSAWASPQSRVVPSRQWLEERFVQAKQRYGEDPPRPLYWGGYRLAPDALEFWQGRENRLHDRVRYRLEAGAWHIERLAS